MLAFSDYINIFIALLVIVNPIGAIPLLIQARISTGRVRMG